MIIRVAALKRDVDCSLPDAERLLDDFKEEQRQRVKYIKEVMLIVILKLASIAYRCRISACGMTG